MLSYAFLDNFLKSSKCKQEPFFEINLDENFPFFQNLLIILIAIGSISYIKAQERASKPPRRFPLLVEFSRRREPIPLMDMLTDLTKRKMRDQVKTSYVKRPIKGHGLQISQISASHTIPTYTKPKGSPVQIKIKPTTALSPTIIVKPAYNHQPVTTGAIRSQNTGFKFKLATGPKANTAHYTYEVPHTTKVRFNYYADHFTS